MNSNHAAFARQHQQNINYVKSVLWLVINSKNINTSTYDSKNAGDKNEEQRLNNSSLC